MKHALLIVCSVVGAITVAGCGAITDRLDKDLTRTVEIAEKYNTPEVAQCAKFLQGAVAGVKEMAAEPTAGIFSAAFKAALLRHLGSKYEDAFTTECGAVAAHMLVEIGRRAPIPGVN